MKKIFLLFLLMSTTLLSQEAEKVITDISVLEGWFYSDVLVECSDGRIWKILDYRAFDPSFWSIGDRLMIIKHPKIWNLLNLENNARLEVQINE